MNAPLRTHNLAVGYLSKHTPGVVLEALNLSVRSGELVCLLGPNGIGKSTLLRTLSRIQPSLSGSIEIEGVDLRQLSPIDLARRLGVVLTERPLVGALPAYRLVELGRYPHLSWLGGLGPRDREVVSWAMEAVAASHLAMRDSNKLSDGERQRLMIARALAQEPALLLLDEPTAFLDVPSRVELMGLLRRLAREQGLAIVVSTHDLELALRMADTLWVIAPGGRLYSGAPEDLILAGRIREAFPAETISFRPEERLFKPVTGAHGSAVVNGEGLHAVLAGAVLEREGFEIVRDRRDVLQVTIASVGTHWEAVVGDRHERGEAFATLAEFVRSLVGEKSAATKLVGDRPAPGR
jgi:iron complex transport system ATP-binding protein